MSSPNGRPPASARPVPPQTRLSARQVARQAAATFCGGKAISNDVSSANVLKIAAAFLRWLEGGEPTA